MKTFEYQGGTSVDEVAHDLVAHVRHHGGEVAGIVNGITLVAKVGTTPQDLIAYWWDTYRKWQTQTGQEYPPGMCPL